METCLGFNGIQVPDGRPKDNVEYVRLIRLIGTEVVEMLHATSPRDRERAIQQLPEAYQTRRMSVSRVCDVCRSRVEVRKVPGTEIRLCHMHYTLHEARKAEEERAATTPTRTKRRY